MEKSEKRKKTKRRCPLCGGGRAFVVSHEKSLLPQGFPLPNEYDVVSCCECGFAFADVNTTEEDLSLYYSRYSKYGDIVNSSGAGGSSLDKKRLSDQAARIAARISNRDAVIMDIGCGSGGLLAELEAMGFKNLIGCDASEKCVNNINARGFKGLRYFCGEPFVHEERADVIILSGVLEHLLDPLGAMKLLKNALKEDGIVYAEVPDAMAFRDYCACLCYEFNLEHINYFSKDTLEGLMQAAGFDIVDGQEGAFRLLDGLTPFTCAFVRNSPSHLQGDNILRFSGGELHKSLSDFAFKSFVHMDGLLNLVASFMGNEQVVFWGAGVFLNKVLASKRINRKQIACIVDSNPSLQSLEMGGIPVIAPLSLKTEAYRSLPVLITGLKAEYAIKKALEDMEHIGDVCLMSDLVCCGDGLN